MEMFEVEEEYYEAVRRKMLAKYMGKVTKYEKRVLVVE
jgi:hypothetical protein